MRKHNLSLIVAALFLATLWGCGSNIDSGGDQTAGQTPEQIRAAASFVGSTKCLSCHGDKENWGHTLHKTVLRKPGEFSKPQGKTAAFYAGTINKGLDLLVGTTTTGPAKEIFYYNIAGTWHATQTSPTIDATQAANLKFKAGIRNGVAGYELILTDLAGTSGVKTYPVLLTYGGEANYKQRYVVTIGNSKYVSPLQYNDKGVDADPTTFSTGDTLWVHYNAQDWYDATANALKIPAKSKAFDGNCAGCHFTGYTLAKSAAGEEMADAVNDPNGALDFDGDGTLDEINVGCEACHGAGSVHASTSNPAYIVNPANLTPEKANMVCGQCHIRGLTKDNFSALSARAKLEFPAKLDVDGNLQKFRPGDDINDYYEWISTAGQYWGNLVPGAGYVASKQHHQQFIDILQGPHSPTQAFSPTCQTCHELHDNRAPAGKQVVTSLVAGGVTIRTAANDNTLCLACHATFGVFAGISKAEVADVSVNGPSANLEAVVTAHSRHIYDPVNTGASLCIGCHMPFTAKTALNYDIRAHSFTIIEPKLSLSTAVTKGVPNACSGCHAATTDQEINTLQNSFDVLFVEQQAILSQWASTGKADPTSLAWNNYNWAFDPSRAACQRCHTTTGAKNYLASPSTYLAANNNFSHLSQPWSKTDPATFEVLTCNGCHQQKSTGLHAPGAITADYGYVSGGVQVLTLTRAYPNVAGSNVCLACHVGRESGATIRNLASAGGVTIDFSNLSFINSHYLAAGGTVFGVTGYEYTGRSYAKSSVYVHDQIGLGGLPGGSNGPCVGCHLSSPESHLFLPVTNDAAGNISAVTSPICAQCHTGGFATTPAFLNQQKAGMAAALEALKGALDSRGYFFANSYPYFHADTNLNGVLDPAEISGGNGVKNWLTVPDADTTGNVTGKNNMGAAFNYNLLVHDPGAFAHNQLYSKRLIFDAIDWVDNNALSGTIDLSASPAAAAYLNPLAPVTVLTRP